MIPAPRVSTFPFTRSTCTNNPALLRRRRSSTSPIHGGAAATRIHGAAAPEFVSPRSAPPPRDRRPRRCLQRRQDRLSKVSMCLNRNDTSAQELEVNTTLNYTEDQQEIGEPVKLYPASEQVDGKQGTEMLDNKEDLSQQRKGAKIHDFCLGIPFGGIVFGGGLFGFLFSKTPATSMISGAAILAMGFISLKVWRQGKSSLPLIVGQAAIAATLFWKHFQLYPVTKKILPSGFYVIVSAAMLCFYSYVLIAGGNPPPKKKLAASPSS